MANNYISLVAFKAQFLFFVKLTFSVSTRSRHQDMANFFSYMSYGDYQRSLRRQLKKVG